MGPLLRVCTRWLLKSFVYFTLLYSLSAIGIGFLMSSPLVFDLNLTMEGGEGERALLQHRQLHRLFTSILYTAIYLLHCVYNLLLCYSVYRSIAQRTVYLHRQELSVIDGRFCR